MLKAADDVLIELCGTHMQAGNRQEAKLLIDLSRKIHDNGPSGWGYMTHPQTEWTGGNSSDPNNFTIREPNIVPMAQRFPAEQVATDPSGTVLP